MTNDLSTRRALVSGLGVGAAALAIGACAQGETPAAAAETPATTGFRPTRHPQDAWLDELPGQHRVFIDAATASGAGEGVLYANNLYVANMDGYQLGQQDLAIVVCLRHFATVFAYEDPIWAKYGEAVSNLLQFTDPMTKKPPTTNLLNSADYGMSMPNMGNTIGSVASRGTQFAVCQMATQFIAGQIAMATGGEAAAVYEELTSNLIPNSHLVTAGVVAVNRAQEYGYSLLTAL
jgi:hypothetical protein